MSENEVRDEPENGRYVVTIDGLEAVLEYDRQGDRIRLHHTEVPPALEGQGVGSRLARTALESAREQGLAVWPECPFVASYIRRHREYMDLVAEDYPGRADLEG